MITNVLVASDYLLARLERAPVAYAAAMDDVMDGVASYLFDRVYEQLSGEALQVRSGTLRDALEKDVVRYGAAITAQVFIAEGVPYARIQERGGTTRPHDIVAREASVLRFEIGGDTAFARVVHHPGSRIHESMYMRKVLIRERSTVNSMIREGLQSVQS